MKSIIKNVGGVVFYSTDCVKCPEGKNGGPNVENFSQGCVCSRCPVFLYCVDNPLDEHADGYRSDWAKNFREWIDSGTINSLPYLPLEKEDEKRN